MLSNLKSASSLLVLAGLPAAAAAQNSSLDNLTANQIFPAWQTTVQYELPTSGPKAGKPGSFGNYTKVTASIKYDKPSNSYTVRDTGNVSATSAFGPSQIISSTNEFTTYQKVVGSTTETLRLLKPGAGNTRIALTYASYGHWRKNTPGGWWNGNPLQSDTYFAYGIKTTGAQMPKVGGASYTTSLDGTFANWNALYSVDGSGTLSTTFGTSMGTLNFSIPTLNGTVVSGGPAPAIAFGPISGTGKITTSSASFTGAGSNGTYKIDFSGYFFGPTAQELGAVFRLSGGGGNGNGAMVGKQ